MSGASWKSGVSGSWGTSADWSPAVVPNSAATAVSIAAPGSYIVSIGTTQDFSAGTLTIGAGATLDVLGTLDLISFTNGDMLIGHGGVLETSGALAGAIVDDGLIDATHSSVLDTSPAGSGNLAVGAGATLALDAAVGERVVFTGTRATLLLGDPGQFTGTISGFEQSDTIALAGIQASGVTAVGDALEVFSGSSVVDVLPMPADYDNAKFSVVESGGTALISETGVTYAVEGATWGSTTVTWSFADTTLAQDAADGESFSSFVTQSADQAILEQALQEWSAVTGLNFVEVGDGAGTADIRIGWGSFTGGEIGETDFSDQGTTFEPDVVVRLEDPAFDAITTNTGTALYSGTESSVMQVALHELGHAIGMDHTPDPDAIMNPTATSTNRQLDASDIAGGQALYAGDVACYAAGTRIMTVSGEVAIETLRPGDLVRSGLTGAAVAVVWTGHRRVDCRGSAPVVVRAGAFAEGRPARDLVLSPEHAVAFEGVLIPVRCLVDGVAVRRLGVAAVTYWHVELAAHDLVLAEGLAAESYVDVGNRGCFVEAGGAVRCEGARCLALRLEGGEVMRARRRLAERADGIRVLADGTGLRPVRRRGRVALFLVPAGVGSLAVGGVGAVACMLDGRPSDERRWRLGGRSAVLEILQ